ncbi:LADA_0H08570g1_1 [Lachancea dasiensis]|uniref:anthranilate synthase n=1 Tax=Lachancea dasiensis TaxID=1072105 RepID=A0A1G4K2T1_9SACH|nr:LADA_0H08570g1_1 [Lachancea dasiensis]
MIVLKKKPAMSFKRRTTSNPGKLCRDPILPTSPMVDAQIQPGLADLRNYVKENDSDINMYPVFCYLPAMDLTPHLAYLKLAQINNADRKQSFLLESATSDNTLGRFSFLGTNPRKTINTGASQNLEVDPLLVLEKELEDYKLAENIPGIPKLSGGAIGYVSYDCVKYFEPKIKRPLKDVLQLPEACLMLYDTIVAFDHVYQRFQIIHNINLSTVATLEEGYEEAQKIIRDVVATLEAPGTSDNVVQPKIKLNQTFSSNIGEEGYKSHVATLKRNIKVGNIIQAVPSQRVARPTSLHPFNIYKQLRTVNPSPYLFYIDLLDFQVIGASPELLCQTDAQNKVITHPIAGTVKRGSTPAEDDKLADSLRNSMKDRSEHVMLVDLARNDVNRVCNPLTTNVDKLLTVQKFSHVQHLVSQVSGILRDDKTRFDALRSIFPAGTVSGAPKVKAMGLIGELEGETRGVYAGAVGHWSYDGKSMDTCIALRTMVYKDGIAYLQAGGGIVFDSDEQDEYEETLNKMLANNRTIVQAEEFWASRVGTTE